MILWYGRRVKSGGRAAALYSGLGVFVAKEAAGGAEDIGILAVKARAS
jgi:hypothetical protein